MAEFRTQQELGTAPGTRLCHRWMRFTHNDFFIEAMSWRPPELLLRFLYYFCHKLKGLLENP